ncbi:hypothetical protein Bca101_096632 [Brassica carinata]
MRAVALLSVLLLTKQIRRCNKRTVNICTTAAFFLMWQIMNFQRTFPPKHCIDHKVWYNEDFFQSESFMIEEDKTTLPDFAENVLLVANLSPQTTKISHIIKFFKNVGEVVSVRLIVNRECKHVGYGFIEFASPCEAQALKMMNGAYMDDHKIMLMKGLDQTPDFVEAVATSRSKTLYVANLPREKTEISHIIDFFKDVGEVVHVRLICNLMGNHVGTGFVEFASADEAKKVRSIGDGLHPYHKVHRITRPSSASWANLFGSASRVVSSALECF